MIAVNTNGGAERSNVTVGLKPIVALNVEKYALKLRETTWLIIAYAIHHTSLSLMASRNLAP